MTTAAAARRQRLATYTVTAGRRELIAHATVAGTLRVEGRPAARPGPTFTVESPRWRTIVSSDAWPPPFSTLAAVVSSATSACSPEDGDRVEVPPLRRHRIRRPSGAGTHRGGHWTPSHLPTRRRPCCPPGLRQLGVRSGAYAQPMSTLNSQTRVFISYDFDEDLFVAKALGEQLRASSRFAVANWSMKEAAPERLWKEEAQRRLNRSDVMLIVLGQKTHRASGVLVEVRMARALNPPVPLRQVIGYRGSHPTPVPDGGRVYRWGHDRLEQILDVPRRRAA